MVYKTLLEFATDEMLFILLAKERVKYRKRNSSDKHKLDKEADFYTLGNRKKLSRLMPPRSTWIRPKKRKSRKKGALASRKVAEKSLLLTYKHHLDLHREYDYQKELNAFATRIRERLQSDGLHFQSPTLMPIYKDTEVVNGKTVVTCRPLSVFMNLEDKIILALTSRYLTKYLDRCFHPNVLSYRKARRLPDGSYRPLEFNDGIKMIMTYLDEHQDDTIYAADCDIKKFYDIIDHQVVRDCFDRILSKSQIPSEGQIQVKRVVEAYLASYNFYDNALEVAQHEPNVFSKIWRKVHDKERQNEYVLGWVDELKQMPVAVQRQRGVPQGGALSLLIANIVLNDVDQALVSTTDPDRLFIRYCDDMILLHTDKAKCADLMNIYTQSLSAHQLYYHDFKPYTDRHAFWHVKSHQPYLWGDGEVGSSNRYVGFLGYELRRDGRLRLRKSNIQNIKEQLERQLYIHKRRVESSKGGEDPNKLTGDALERILDIMPTYTAFDEARFNDGQQHEYLGQIKKKVEKLLKL